METCSAIFLTQEKISWNRANSTGRKRSARLLDAHFGCLVVVDARYERFCMRECAALVLKTIAKNPQ